MTWTERKIVRNICEKHPAVDIVVRMSEGWSYHQTLRNSAVLAYFGFLSIFPLVMVTTTLFNISFRNNRELKNRILESAFSEIPVVGDQVLREVGTIQGDILTIAIGMLIALWAATRAFNALQTAFDDTWEVPIKERDKLPVRRLKALVGGFTIGSTLVVTGTLANISIGGSVGYWAAKVVAFGVNMLVLTTMMRYMTAAKLTLSMVWRGALLSAAGLLTMHLLGGFFVRRYLASAGDTAGGFATVIALTAWINLLAIVSLLGAELNAARYRKNNNLNTSDTTEIAVVGSAPLKQREQRWKKRKEHGPEL